MKRRVGFGLIFFIFVAMNRSIDLKRVFYWVVVAIIILGIALRLLMYVQNRSLFIDEACLSSQIVDRTYAGLFDNFEFQYAPPLFAVGLKAMTDLFGSHEYALRLIPLIASIIGLLLFYRLCKIYLKEGDCIFPLFLFSFGMPMLQYASEVKQYSTDVLVTLLLLLLAIRWRIEDFNSKRAILLALLGSVLVWFSMPSVFVLFGFGMYYLIEVFKKRNWSKLGFIALPVLTWLFSFAVYYFTIIRKDIGLDNLEDYHARFFLPLLPSDLHDLERIKEILLTFFRTSIGSTVIAIGLGILSLFMGLFHFIKKDSRKIILFTFPILAAMLASGLKLYSLIPRLTLFFVPILILLMAIGIAQILKKSPSVLKWLMMIPIVVVLFNQKGYPYFYQRFEIEELRPVLYYVDTKLEEKDAAFLHFQAKNAYTFYSQEYKNAEELVIPGIIIGKWDDLPETMKIPEGDRLWLIFSHVSEEEMLLYSEHMQGRGYIKIDDFRQKGAAAILFKKE